MRARQPLLLELLMDIQLLHSVHASQIFEAVDGHAGTAGHKLQESGPELHVEALKHLKEPGDDLVVFHEVDQFGVSAEVVDVDGGPPRNHDFQFFLVEYSDEPVGDELVEALEQSLELVLYAGRHLGVGTQLHVFQFVLLGKQHALTAGHQLSGLDFAEVVKRVGEVGVSQVILDGTVVEYPLETLEEFVVLLLHVKVGDGQVEDVLVEGRCEVRVQKIAVVEGFADYASDEFEVF